MMDPLHPLKTMSKMFIAICLLTLPSASIAEVQNFTVGVFLPLTGPEKLGPEAEIAVNLTVSRVNQKYQDYLHIDYIIKDTECNKDVALTKFVDMMCEGSKYDQTVHAIIGPTCDDVCQVVGGLAGNRGVPVISSGCGSPGLSDTDRYPTFLRTAGTFTEMEKFLEQILLTYEWSRLTVVHANGTVWLDLADEFTGTLKHAGFQVRQLNIRHPETLEEDLWAESQNTRVFLICAYSLDIVLFMEMAHRLQLNNGQYAFITIDFANSATIHNATYNPALDGLLDITTDVTPSSVTYQAFTSELFDLSGQKAKSTCVSSNDYELGIHHALLSDAITLYASAVNSTLTLGGDARDGAQIAGYLYGASITGVSGPVTIDSRGSREARFMLHNIQTGCYVAIATYNQTSRLVMVNTTVVWPGGSTDVPASGPFCGWNGEHCTQAVDHSIYIIIGTSACVLILTVLGVLLAALKYVKRFGPQSVEVIWRGREAASKLASMDWRISFKELKKPKESSEGEGASEADFSQVHLTAGLKPIKEFGSRVSIESSDSMRSTVRVAGNLYYYNKNVVIAKPIDKPFGITVTAGLLKELNQIRQLDCVNINPLVGACIERDNMCVVNLYCRKGSLYDFLHCNDLSMDTRFIACFSTDIAKGLHYIHSSEVGFHGRLKSRNVFLDIAFTCKIGDFHIASLREGETVNTATEFYKTRNLWSAPEVLSGDIERDSPLDRVSRWQRADVWSFGVLLFEILLRKRPYNDYFDTDPEEAENLIRGGRVRPDVGQHDILEQMLNSSERPAVEVDYLKKMVDTMNKCWLNPAAMRQSTHETTRNVRQFSSKIMSKNTQDNMIHMLSRNEELLTRQVQQRTQELEEERDRVNRLLYRMLPRKVAHDLVCNRDPDAAHFDCVTIFFSDIVQFTQLASTCRPQEVMEIVNYLYSEFDSTIDHFQVYKVETIGDAYMVAGGIPEPNTRHAQDVADMALALLGKVGTMSIPQKNGYRLQIRIGLHSGPVVAGVVGKKMPRYCLFGDTVNVANRMESHGKPLRIQMSQTTKDLLDDSGRGYVIKQRSELVNIKGKGLMPTYWLLGNDRKDHSRRQTPVDNTAATGPGSRDDADNLPSTSFPPPSPGKGQDTGAANTVGGHEHGDIVLECGDEGHHAIDIANTVDGHEHGDIVLECGDEGHHAIDIANVGHQDNNYIKGNGQPNGNITHMADVSV